MQTERTEGADDVVEGSSRATRSSASGGTAAEGVGADGVGPIRGYGGPATEEEADHHRSAVDAVDGLLDEVERALARLDDGTYGRCEACGEPIPDDRLSDRPTARTCDRCDGADRGALPEVPSGPVTA